MKRYFLYHILLILFFSINCENNNNLRALKKAGIFNVYASDKGRRIIYSKGVGIASKDDVQGLIDSIKELSKDWQDEKGFVYVAFIEELKQVAPEASEKYVLLHQTLSKINCKAIAYIEGNSYEVSVQANKHKQRSGDRIVQNRYFETEYDALEWFDKFGF